MPAGLITAIHYVGTPNTLTAMYRGDDAGDERRADASARAQLLDDRAARARSPASRSSSACRSRARDGSRRRPSRCSTRSRSAFLLYLVVEIAQNAIVPISRGLDAWHAGAAAFPAALIAVFVVGLLIGLVGLGSAATHFTRQRRSARRDIRSCSRAHRDRHRRAQLRRGARDRRVRGVGSDRGCARADRRLRTAQCDRRLRRRGAADRARRARRGRRSASPASSRAARRSSARSSATASTRRRSPCSSSRSPSARSSS